MSATSKQLVHFNDTEGINIIIWGFGILKLAIHLFTLQGYGFHADELYYIELGKSFKWGFLDISPFVSWVAGVSEYLTGNSIISYRILPSLFSAATVIVTGHITRLLGGRSLAVVIACSAIICSPAFLATSYLLQPAVFDQFFWAMSTFSILAYSKRQKLIYLYLCAFALGLGMLNKFSILLLVGSVGCAWVLISAKLTHFKFKRVIGPFVLFLLIISPNILWQWNHGFPVFNYTLMVGKGAYRIEIWDYILQLLLFHGASVFAAGGLCWSMLLEKVAIMSKTFFIGSLYLFALLSLPIVIPFLPMNLCRGYIKGTVRLTGFSRPLRYEDGTTGKIPQFFADMTDWEMLNQKIKHAARYYPRSKRSSITILTDSYAVAGALKYYGENKVFHVISAHNSFLMDSPETLHMPTVLYLSKEAPSKMSNVASKVTVIDNLKTENSHLNGIYIYRLTSPSARFKKKYLKDRLSFYPGTASKGMSKRNSYKFQILLQWFWSIKLTEF
ncbi:MAG: glycosyltransferase family 39 protein [Pedobacter sp.]|nr:MAG: glycosyltransferase family 39 protein [Pedobacter sp.]